MKAEIITIYSINYGNRLQNYALQEALKKIGVDVTTKRVDNDITKRKIKEIIKAIRNKRICDYFSRFDIQNIKFRYSKECFDSSSVDYYIAGSDQIWNPNFSFNSDREFLTFAPSKKKIAYAASIGVSELSGEQKTRFKNNLSDFHAISVRENDAADLIYNITGKRPEVVLDPTMLLTKDEWEKVSQQSKLKVEKPFVAKYFLGIRNKEIEEKIESYARECGCEIIDITADNCPYVIGPAEFVYLLQNSKMNFVDSYHGTVFSIIFNKPFYTFARPNEKGYGNMNSRFETIFALLPINDRYVVNVDNAAFSSIIEYRNVDAKLEVARNKSIEFLKKALEV